jgi:hypothetical protein
MTFSGRTWAKWRCHDTQRPAETLQEANQERQVKMSEEWANDTIPERYKYELMILMRKMQANILETRKGLTPEEIKELPQWPWLTAGAIEERLFARLAWFK